MSDRSVYRLALHQQQTFMHSRALQRWDVIVLPTGRMLISHSAGLSAAGRVHTCTRTTVYTKVCLHISAGIETYLHSLRRTCLLSLGEQYLFLSGICPPLCRTHLFGFLHTSKPLSASVSLYSSLGIFAYKNDGDGCFLIK